ncbi:MAG: hypothetical protein ACR5KW_03670 [Wolbachia sp.]
MYKENKEQFFQRKETTKGADGLQYCKDILKYYGYCNATYNEMLDKSKSSNTKKIPMKE